MCRRVGELEVRVALAVAALVGLSSSSARPARAEVIYDLIPTASVGVTDNVTVVGTTAAPTGTNSRVADQFTTLSVAAGLHYNASRSTHSLNYRLSMTQFFQHSEANVLTNSFNWGSSFELTSRLVFRLGALATISRTSAVDFTGVGTVVPQGAAQGANLYLVATATQDIVYQQDARHFYSETLSYAQLHYFDTDVPLPGTTIVTLSSRANRLSGRELYFLNGSISDSISDAQSLATGTYQAGHLWFAHAELGWRHDLSPAWTTEVQGGPILMWGSGSAVLAPGAAGSINYASQYWFATLATSQVPNPNLFLGDATINDMVLLRLALPLGRRERYYVVGYGGYTYARIATPEGGLTRAYDQLSAGASIVARLEKLPFSFAASYTLLSQRGSSSMTRGDIPDLARQVVMLNIVGTFTFGPGTPPIIGVM